MKLCILLFFHTHFLHCPFWGLFIQWVSSMKKTHLACPQHSIFRFQSAKSHDNIHKRRTNMPGNNPHHFWIHSSPRTSIIGSSRNTPRLATTGPSYHWYLKGISSVKSLALGLGVTVTMTSSAQSTGRSASASIARADLALNQVWAFPKHLITNGKRRLWFMLAMFCHWMSTCNSGGSWRARFVSL